MAEAGVVQPARKPLLMRMWRRLTMRDSLVGRLIRLASLWFICALLITGVALTAVFNEAAMHRFQLGVGQIAENLYADTDIDPSGRMTTPEFFDTRTKRMYSGLYWQVSEVSSSGTVSDAAKSLSLMNRRIDLPPLELADARAHAGTTVFYDSRGPIGERLRIAAIYSIIHDRYFVFLAGEDREPMDKDVHTFALITAAALAALALGSLAAIWFQVRVGLRPLFDMTGEIARIQSGEQTRVEKSYPAEIQPVANQLNAFIDDARDVVERQRMHVGNLAHALKTPLSVLMTSAGDAEGALPETVRRQAETMRAQVDHHLRRARVAARSQALSERTEVEPVLDELAVMLEQVFADKGVVIDWRAPDELAFRGEKQDLQEIAGNLLENACIWCRRKVRILAEFDTGTQTMILNIDDDGPGMPETRFDEVLKRGARLDESVPGSGLGLSIVDELVRAYGGRLQFARSAMGGLRVTASLPGTM